MLSREETLGKRRSFPVYLDLLYDVAMSDRGEADARMSVCPSFENTKLKRLYRIRLNLMKL